MMARGLRSSEWTTGCEWEFEGGSLPRVGGELVGLLEPRDVDDEDLVELDPDRDLEGDRLDVLPDGEGVREPERDFLVDFVDF